MNYLLYIFIFMSLPVIGGDYPSDEEIEALEIQATDLFVSKFEKLDLNDGVSLDEANVIVGAIYSSTLGDGCGAPGEIHEKGKSWVVPTYSGFSVKPDEPIYISKSTGKVTRGDSLLIENPKNIQLTLPSNYEQK